MELFRTFNEQGEPVALVPRNEVHAAGYWHKSAQVFVFNAGGELLLQRRAPSKDLYAGLWDYSVGEHLQPDENFAAGAQRGLREELGIVAADLMPLGGERWVVQSGTGFVDREIQQAYCCNYDGEIIADSVEVAEVRFLSLPRIFEWAGRDRSAFTPWFIVDLKELFCIDI